MFEGRGILIVVLVSWTGGKGVRERERFRSLKDCCDRWMDGWARGEEKKYLYVDKGGFERPLSDFS